MPFNAADMKALRVQRAAAGGCLDCRDSAEPGRSRCAKHLAKQAASFHSRKVVRRDVATLALALAFAVAACFVACGCGSVTGAADAGGERVVGGPADVGRDVEPQDTAMAVDAASSTDSMLSTDAAVDHASCSWECRAFCDCGPLPCCRSTAAADCCTR